MSHIGKSYPWSFGCGSILNHQGTADFSQVSIYQGKPFWGCPMFDPQPQGSGCIIHLNIATCKWWCPFILVEKAMFQMGKMYLLRSPEPFGLNGILINAHRLS